MGTDSGQGCCFASCGGFAATGGLCWGCHAQTLQASTPGGPSPAAGRLGRSRRCSAFQGVPWWLFWCARSLSHSTLVLVEPHPRRRLQFSAGLDGYGMRSGELSPSRVHSWDAELRAGAVQPSCFASLTRHGQPGPPPLMLLTVMEDSFGCPGQRPAQGGNGTGKAWCHTRAGRHRWWWCHTEQWCSEVMMSHREMRGPEEAKQGEM